MARTVQISGRQVLICRDYDELSRATADRLLAAAEQAVRERGRFMVALSGGKTPTGMYRLLAGEMRNRVPWDRCYLFWSDERCVPPDDPESNFGLADRELLQHIAVPPERIVRMKGEIEPPRAADEYERELHEAFQLAPGELPRFDLMMLGMGANGHTASLFPGSEALAETQRLVVAPYIVEANVPHRLSLTFPVINNARHIIEQVSGENKSAALFEVLLRPQANLPAQMVRPTNGTLTWIVDEAAARQLRQAA